MRTKKKDGILYRIDEKIEEELVSLILDSESLNAIAKQYWFDTLPAMTTWQVAQLTHTLRTEKIRIEYAENKFLVKKESIAKRFMLKYELRKKSMKHIRKRNMKSCT